MGDFNRRLRVQANHMNQKDSKKQTKMTEKLNQIEQEMTTLKQSLKTQDQTPDLKILPQQLPT